MSRTNLEEIKNYMQNAGRLAASILDDVSKIVMPGATTNNINDHCHEMMIVNGATPATLGYKGYPKSVCTSTNSVVCHGIPNDLKLKEGDVLNIDITVILDEWFADTSRMYFVGKPKKNAIQLVNASYYAMFAGINASISSNTVGDVGFAIEQSARKSNFKCIKEYTGHGIGKKFHTEPYIFSYGSKGKGMRLYEGLIYTVEPIISAGSTATTVSKKDGWTVFSKDFSLSAQFEHTICVNANNQSCTIFTESPSGFTKPPYDLSKIVPYKRV